MSRPEPGIVGPSVAVPADIDAVNTLFSQAFTDRYHRDGMVGVRVPFLNPAVWRYAIAAAGDGALVWREPAGEIVAFNMVHQSGREGWMGPLAVRTDLQGEGMGRRIVSAGMEHLKRRGATTIGLETMPRTVENIGFYTRLGFRPGHLTVTLSRGVSGAAETAGLALSSTAARRDQWLAACRELTERVRPGSDYTREVMLTAELGLGDVTLLVEQGSLRGYALWHGAALAADREPDELRVLKLVAETPAAGLRMLPLLQHAAVGQGLERITLRAETERADIFAQLVGDGFEVLWTDLRMSLQGWEEPAGTGGLVFSNWEI